MTIQRTARAALLVRAFAGVLCFCVLAGAGMMGCDDSSSTDDRVASAKQAEANRIAAQQREKDARVAKTREGAIGHWAVRPNVRQQGEAVRQEFELLADGTAKTTLTVPNLPDDGGGPIVNTATGRWTVDTTDPSVVVLTLESSGDGKPIDPAKAERRFVLVGDSLHARPPESGHYVRSTGQAPAGQ